MRTLIAIVAIAGVGCAANPNAPEPMDKMQIWAAKHAHEICTVVHMGDRGILMPLVDYSWALDHGLIVVPISYCNPAE